MLFYAIISLWLAIYSLHGLYLLWRYHRTKGTQPPPPNPCEWSKVTVQLPIYNEYTTIERLITSAVSMDYPKNLIEIQVLDDSTDETSLLAADLVLKWQKAGFNIFYLRREHRKGYKAGALAYGLSCAAGEFLALFDADFIPPPNFLKQALPFFHDPRVGCVQARWGHTNREYSLLTRLQAMMIDAHFIVEQTARSRSGLLMNFNGSAGIWRKTCIADAGGWSSQTLTEDFDLSYRAQLRGWRIAYTPDLVVPAELPVEIAAYKNQQARWARGSLQTARKMLIPLISSALPLRIKIMGVIHLTHYLVHPLLLLSIVFSLVIKLQASEVFEWIPVLMLLALITPLLFLTGQAPESPPWLIRLKLIPAAMLLSIGMSVNNAQAALKGLLGPAEGTFFRTPKYALKQHSDHWETSRYALSRDSWGILEFVLIILSIWGMINAIRVREFYMIPWLLLYGSGYGLTTMISLEQMIRRKHQNSTLPD
jgi:cellulose synthase/poly-beta-1,6-N-acetylglucosamine synthase-like glycosyltransferase